MTRSRTFFQRKCSGQGLESAHRSLQKMHRSNKSDPSIATRISFTFRSLSLRASAYTNRSPRGSHNPTASKFLKNLRKKILRYVSLISYVAQQHHCSKRPLGQHKQAIDRVCALTPELQLRSPESKDLISPLTSSKKARCIPNPISSHDRDLEIFFAYCFFRFQRKIEAGSTSSGLLKPVVRPRTKIDFLTIAKKQIYLSHNWENKNSGA
jgi:hypothetical protein